MDKVKIVHALRDKKVLQEGTSVHAEVTASGLGGQPIRKVKGVLLGDYGPIKAKGWTRDNAGKDHTYTVYYDDIHAVEGMDLARIAQAYKIKIK